MFSIGLLLWTSTPVMAQGSAIQPGFAFRYGMGVNLNQAFINQGLTGQVYPGLSPVTSFPFANPLFNPAANPIVNPFINPFINPAVNPAALANYFNPAIANPLNPNNVLYSPAFNASLALRANAANSFTGATNPYLATANPYLGTASLSTTYSGNPYGGYDTGASPYSGYGYYETPLGGYLRGTADIISSQGKWFKDVQQAALSREQVKQERIATRRKMFDEYLYERQNTPTFEEDRQRLLQQQISRSLNNPPAADILSGQALNNILTDIRKIDDKKGSKPAIDIDEDVARHINFSPGSGNPGLLKNEGRVNWPVALQGEDFKTQRELLNSLAPEAVRQAVNGRVDAGTLKDLTDGVAKLRQELVMNIRELTPNQYIEASRFLGYFEDALRILARPDAGDFFNTKALAKQMSVADLVKYMADKGLTFAPAVTGDEPAYMALHRALVAFDLGAKATLTAEK
jgi:hypothetical protein